MRGFRDKPADQIRADALAMARRKLTAGCQPCVDAYLELARRNGATDDEIGAVLSTRPNQPVVEQGR